MWLSGLVLARAFANPCLGHKPKARVATYRVFEVIIVWHTNNVKLLKISTVFNNLNHMNIMVPPSKENMVHARKMWKEYGCFTFNVHIKSQKLKVKYI
jgi:hypothetical protein